MTRCCKSPPYKRLHRARSGAVVLLLAICLSLSAIPILSLGAGVVFAKDGGGGHGGEGDSGHGSSGGGDNGSGSGHGSGSDGVSSRGSGSTGGNGSSGRGSGHADSGSSGRGRRSGEGREDRSRSSKAQNRKANGSDRSSVVWSSRRDGAVEVRYADGWSEAVDASRYTLRDPGRSVVASRPAKRSDRERLQALAE